MNVVTATDISHSTQTAWKAVFGQPLPVGVLPRSPAAPDGDPFLIARIHIVGSIPRTIVLVCPMEEARRMTAGFFSQDPATVEKSLIRDVFGEIANMIGGQIKRHFPHSSRLSLPEVNESDKSAPFQEGDVQAIFECGRRPLAVRLVQP